MLQLLSEVTPNELEKEKLQEMASAEGQEMMFDYLNRPKRTILELLSDFPHATSHIPYQLLFELFTPVRPRAFSIASSPEVIPRPVPGWVRNILNFIFDNLLYFLLFFLQAHRAELHILVAIVKYKTKLQKPRLGLCSNWLASLKPGDTISVCLQRGSLRFPSKSVRIAVEDRKRERIVTNGILFF